MCAFSSASPDEDRDFSKLSNWKPKCNGVCDLQLIEKRRVKSNYGSTFLEAYRCSMCLKEEVR